MHPSRRRHRLRTECTTDFVISDKGAISFSHDGKHIFFGVAPPDPPETDPANEVLADDKVNGDLWHYKDEHIQPMQKVRATQDRNRTYRAVHHIAEKQTVQLGDLNMAEVTPTEDGMWALGVDARPLRADGRVRLELQRLLFGEHDDRRAAFAAGEAHWHSAVVAGRKTSALFCRQELERHFDSRRENHEPYRKAKRKILARGH